MQGASTIHRPSRSTVLYSAAGFLLVAIVAIWQFGPEGLFLCIIVAGITLIVLGIGNRTGWSRPVLIIVGILLMFLPLAITLLDLAFGHWEVTLR